MKQIHDKFQLKKKTFKFPSFINKLFQRVKMVNPFITEARFHVLNAMAFTT